MLGKIYKYNKYIVITVIMLLLGSFMVPVYSLQNIEEKLLIDDENINSTLEITLTAQPETKVGLEIIYPDSQFPPTSEQSSALMSTFAYVGQKTTGQDGKAVFTYEADRLGEYTLRTSPEVLSLSVREPDNEKPFFALTFPYNINYTQNNVYDSAILWKQYVDSGSPEHTVQAQKEKLAAMPEGKRSMLVYHTRLINAIFTNPDNYIWCDEKAEEVKTYIDNFFKEYYELGGKLDYVQIDMELERMSVYKLGKNLYIEENGEENSTLSTDLTEEEKLERFKQISSDPRYLTEIRPLLQERGYEFSADTTYGELSTVSEEPNCHIWDTVMYNRSAVYLEEAVYEPIKKYYPNVKFSNYEYTDGKGWYKVPASTGNRLYLGGNRDKVGTHSCISSYGYLGHITQSYIYKPEDYYDTGFYEESPFHSLMFDNNKLRKAWLGDEDKKIQAWVCPYDVNYGDLKQKNGSGEYVSLEKFDSKYFGENIFHIGLLDPDTFLFQGLTDKSVDGVEITDEHMQHRLDVLSEALDELNEMVGYADRRPLVKNLSSWNDHYLLSGMYADGRNVWRITPDLSISGMSLDSFCIDRETPTFYIDGKTITFPQGAIYNPVAESDYTCGYWVVTPKNVEPVISYDSKATQGTFNAYMEIYNAGSGVVTTKIPADCGMTARVSYNNLTMDNENLSLFMASYEGNKLIEAKVLSKTTAYSGMDNIIIVEDIPKPASNATRVSFFLFGDDLQPFVPLATLSSN